MLTGVAAPLLLPNIDTDVIIRIERLSKYSRGEFGHWALETLRLNQDGTEIPDFILNRAPFRAARILLAGANFGCGSVREMAVWALEERGIRCIIAPSFGDMFAGNCLQNGVLAIRLPAAEIDALAPPETADAAAATLTVDLERQQISRKGEAVSFEIDPLARRSLLQGLDPVAITLQRESEIAAFQVRDRAARPWLYV